MLTLAINKKMTKINIGFSKFEINSYIVDFYIKIMIFNIIQTNQYLISQVFFVLLFKKIDYINYKSKLRVFV